MSTFFDLAPREMVEYVGKYLVIPDGLPPDLCRETTDSSSWSRAYRKLWDRVHSPYLHYEKDDVRLFYDTWDDGEADLPELNSYGYEDATLTEDYDEGCYYITMTGKINEEKLPPELMAPIIRRKIRRAHEILEDVHYRLSIAKKDQKCVPIGSMPTDVFFIVRDIIKKIRPSYSCVLKGESYVIERDGV